MKKDNRWKGRHSEKARPGDYHKRVILTWQVNRSGSGIKQERKAEGGKGRPNGIIWGAE
jgi:hypothetical protein